LHVLGIFTGLQDEWMGPGIDRSAIACPVALGLKNPGIGALLPQQTVRTLLTLQRATGLFQGPAQSAAQGGTEIPRQPGFAGKAAVKRKFLCFHGNNKLHNLKNNFLDIIIPKINGSH